MSSPLVIPFNFCPTTNPSRKTTSFDVEAGKYAIVTTNSPYFTIAGTNMFPSITLTNTNNSVGTTETTVWPFRGGVYVHTASITSSTNNSDVRTASYGYANYESGTLSYSTIATQTINNNTTASIAAGYVPTSGGLLALRITTGASSTTSATIQAYYFPDGQAKQFWISGGASGVTLNGNDYIVTLYNQIT
jgi:hypothetical protein